MDIRQTKPWAEYLKYIGWMVEDTKSGQVFIKKVPFTRFSVIKIQRPKNPVGFDGIEKIAKKYHALFVIIEPDIPGFDPNHFKKHHYQLSHMILTHTLTSQIDLNQSEQDIFASFSENARRNIKKAQNNKLKVEAIAMRDYDKNRSSKLSSSFDRFNKLLRNLTQMKGFFVPGTEEMQKKMQALKNNSYLLFAYNIDHPQPIAAVWVSFHNKIMNYIQTGITQEGYALLANYLLVWKAIKLAKQHNLKVFDFEGLYDPRFPKERQRWKNFSRFKSRFHGKLVEYPQPWIKCYNPLFWLVFQSGSIFYKLGLA